MPSDERTPLLRNPQSDFWSFTAPDNQVDFHSQFCKLVGIPSSDLPPDADEPPIGRNTLYGRALRLRRNQIFTYQFTAGLSNTMLLSQVILGAALTALGASQSSHILITVFGAMNTIIAGLVAYLKSRGQPMRARMYRDDLERVVDEIENSEIMWLGISKQMHGYSEINTENAVTVRSEVARLTRLYDRAVRSNTMNSPDMYLATGGETSTLGLKSRPLQAQIQPVQPPPVIAPTTDGPSAATPMPAPAPPVDPDESPASAPKVPVKAADPPAAEASKPEDAKPEAAKPDTAKPDATKSGESKTTRNESAKNVAENTAPVDSTTNRVHSAATPDNPDESPATSTGASKGS
ncbi:hypothetical protein EJ08DRAFT_512952 [Tothia fuscella]|uniref:SMODS and SLOG-associating 2TM effector domain-containing protein n=1 Tax=Tothia fuscella TaxID=1048955 RepID=A0A9P4U2U7_9PEZI|nr:hypothetical protein EJ08DRAFT_512952 [Tothia fuscella]